MAILTAKQMQVAIGQEVFVQMEKLDIRAQVVDVRQSWGRAQVLITPTRGIGAQWVEMSRLRSTSTECGALEVI